MATRVRIEPPNQLPSSGITPIKYKQWKVALKIFLQQTPQFREFYPGGKYTTWIPMEDNPHRILVLHAEDTHEADTSDEEHLAQRRIHLETFLGIIARYSDEGDFDDIMEKSSSLEWIFALHERRYGIQQKGRYFNRIDSIRFDKSTMSDYHKFYTDLRSCFKSNLRKSGDIIKYKGNQILEHDEKLSPTTECLLVYMAMERIDPRLPAEIDRIFGHRMDDNVTLIDLQSEIFTYIPRALATLDREESELNAYSVHIPNVQDYTQTFLQDNDEKQMPEVNAIFNKPYHTQQRQYIAQPRMPFKPTMKYSPRHQYNPRMATVNARPPSACKLCQALDLPPPVFNSHSTNNCRRKSQLQQIEIEEQNADQESYWYNIQNQSHTHQD